MPSGRYNIPVRFCERCEEEYKPNSAMQKRCPPCGVLHRQEYQRKYNNMNRVRIRAWGRNYYWEHHDERRAYAKRKWSESERFKSEIVNRTDFLNHVRDKIVNRRGDTLTVRAVARGVWKRLGIDLRGPNAERKACYRVIEQMLKDFGGEFEGFTNTAGPRYKFPRKERKE